MPEIDTLYIYFDSEIPKIMVPSEFSEQVGVFVDKKTRKLICGYEVEGASEFFLENIHSFNFNLKQLIAAGIFRPEVTEPLLGKPIPVLAWGQGFDRIIMEFFGINDLREMYKNDIDKLREVKIWRR